MKARQTNIIGKIRTFIKRRRGSASFRQIEDRFWTTPAHQIQNELDMAVEQGLMTKEVLPSGTAFYHVDIQHDPPAPPKPPKRKCWYGGRAVVETEFPNWTRQEIREYEERRGTQEEPEKCGGCNARRKLQWVKRSLGGRGSGNHQWSLIFPRHTRVE